MKELLKKSALLGTIGFALGLLVGFGFLIYHGIQTVVTANGAGWTVAYMLICGAMGMVNMGTMTLYEIERWSLTRATLTHLAITLATCCGLGLFLGWFNSSTAWIMLAAFIIAYFIIWLIIYLSYKRRVRKLNEELKHWKDAQGGE